MEKGEIKEMNQLERTNMHDNGAAKEQIKPFAISMPVSPNMYDNGGAKELVKPFAISMPTSTNLYGNGQGMMQQQQVMLTQDDLELEKIREKERIRTIGSIARAEEKAKIQLRNSEMRSLQKEKEEERKKSIHDELQILENGKIQIITRNLRIETSPRDVTNMTSPSLTVLKRAKDDTEQVFRIDCWVEKEKKKVFLDPKSVGNGKYLIGKFVEIGVVFYLPTTSQKKFIVQFIALLLEYRRSERWLPDIEGWMRKMDGKYIFIDEEEETWKYVKKML